MTVTLALFLALAASCAPSVAPETLAALSHAESGFDPLAIHDNQTGRVFHPASLQGAIATASALTAAGHSLDLGLGQINSRANLSSRGIGIADAFDPCTNLRVSAQVLVEGFTACRLGDAQGCVREALSRYNTGDAARGFANGYVQRVQASAGQVIPAIRAIGLPAAPPAVTAAPSPAPLPCAPEWDAWALAECSARPKPHPAASPADGAPSAIRALSLITKDAVQ